MYKMAKLVNKHIFDALINSEFRMIFPFAVQLPQRGGIFLNDDLRLQRFHFPAPYKISFLFFIRKHPECINYGNRRTCQIRDIVSSLKTDYNSN